MKKLGYLLSCAALATALTGALAVHAQDAVDPATLDYVVKAYANTLASTSVHIDSQTQTAVTGQQGQSNGQMQTATYDVAKTADGWNVNGSRTISVTTQNGSINIQIDSVVINGEVYLQISGMPQFGGFGGGQGGQGQGQTGQGQAPAGQDQGQQGQPPAGQDQGQGQPGQGGGQRPQFTIPQGWFDATQMATNGQGVPGVGATDAKTMVLTILDALNLPVSAQSVTAVKELPADTVDGQSMRVIQLTLDPAIILQSDAAALLRGGGFGGFGGGFGFGGFGRRGQGGGQGQGNGNGPQAQGTPGAPGQGTPFPTRQPPNPADYQITFAVYIGDQDQLIHRIYSVVAIASTATDNSGNPVPGRTITTQTNFTKFNEPVTITAPQVAPASS